MKVTNNKKGISLIVLVITIVVIIILAVAVILTIANNNPIGNAKKAVENWNDAEEKERLAILNHELLMLKSDKNKTINDALVLLQEELGENTKLVDNSDYKENTYIIEGCDNSKKYIFDENWGVTEATDLITILQAVRQKCKENNKKEPSEFTYTMENISSDIDASDSLLKEILGDVVNVYDTNKYRFVVKKYYIITSKDKSGRLLYYQDENISEETKEKCEKLGIYLWGDYDGNRILDWKDANYVNHNHTSVNKISKTDRAWIVSDTVYSLIPVVNASDSTRLNNFVYFAYDEKIQKMQEEFNNYITKEGIVKETVNAKNTRDIAVCIPSYIDKYYQFRLQIVRGNLFVVQDESMGTDYQIRICREREVPMLGDLTEDYEVTEEDKDKLLNYINNGEELSESQLLVADTNGDGKITLDDAQLIQDMIDATY